MKSIAKNIKWLTLPVLVVGVIASWNIIPMSLFDQLPSLVQIVLVTSLMIYLAISLVGYVFDSGIPQKIFKKK